MGCKKRGVQDNPKGFGLSKWKDGTAIFQEGKDTRRSSSVGKICHGERPLRSLRQKRPILTQKS